MYKRISPLAILLVTVLALGCGSGGGAGDFNLISIEEEWQLGQQLSQDVARQVRFNNDAAVNAYVQQMGQRIVAGRRTRSIACRGSSTSWRIRRSTRSRFRAAMCM